MTRARKCKRILFNYIAFGRERLSFTRPPSNGVISSRARSAERRGRESALIRDELTQGIENRLAALQNVADSDFKISFFSSFFAARKKAAEVRLRLLFPRQQSHYSIVIYLISARFLLGKWCFEAIRIN